MKNGKKALCLLLIYMLMLSGCNTHMAEHPTETADRSDLLAVITADELTLTLPGIFQLREDPNYNFFCADDEHHCVYGWKTPKQAPAEGAEALTLQRFAQHNAAKNGVDVAIAEQDGFLTYTYATASGGGSDIIFQCLFLETETAFWRIEGSCPEADYESYKEQIWGWLTSVTVAERYV